MKLLGSPVVTMTPPTETAEAEPDVRGDALLRERDRPHLGPRHGRKQC